jgi:hypothetical protein
MGRGELDAALLLARAARLLSAAPDDQVNAKFGRLFI